MNPFLVMGYESPVYFCNRQQETDALLSAIKNQRHVTLISLRRMGKTGLIQHIFYHLKKDAQYLPIYVDIMPTLTLNDFIQELSKAILSACQNQSAVFDKMLHLLSNLRPKISYDAITGQPSVELSMTDNRDAENSLEGLFQYLSNLKKSVVLAIDEFQQINQYPEKNVESLLRAAIQKYRKIQLIYSGSQPSVLYAMFQDQNRPFYQSTQMMVLNAIEEQAYKKFIVHHFMKAGKGISDEILSHVLAWTNSHTYYVQFVCNRLFGLPSHEITMTDVQKVTRSILEENVVVYTNYRNLLTSHQFNLLRAIAKEEYVKQPTSKDFLFTRKLGAASTVKATLEALLKKDIVAVSEQGYFVQDVFFSRWLALH